MSQENAVLWHEGLFLQPHHFQQEHRYFEHLLIQNRELSQTHPWGFTELALDTDLLKLGKINIAQAQGFFPDGTYFHIPQKDLLPTALDIPSGLKNTTLYLALPLKPAKSRLSFRDWAVEDATADQAEPVAIQIAQWHCLLKTEQEDLSQFTYLAIAKVLEARPNHLITLDAHFLPSYLNIQSSSRFQKFIQEIYLLLNHRAELLSGRLTDSQQAGTAEMVDFMLLQLINRYEPLFYHLTTARYTHPEDFFKLLVQLEGELSTFTNDQRRPSIQAVYQHPQLQNTFEPLLEKLRSSLSTVLEQNAIALAIEARDLGIWVVELHDKTILDHHQFILAAYAEAPLESIRTQFPIQVKIAPVEHLSTLVSRALPGVAIQAIAVAPRQIPYHANFCYFSIDTTEELWQQLKRSAGIGLHIGSAFPGLKLELWAIRG